MADLDQPQNEIKKTEEILLALVVAGTAGMIFSVPVALGIAILLAIVSFNEPLLVYIDKLQHQDPDAFIYHRLTGVYSRALVGAFLA